MTDWLAGGLILCLHVTLGLFCLVPVGPREELEIFVQFEAVNLSAPLVSSHLPLIARLLLLIQLTVFPNKPADVRHTRAVFSLVHLDREVVIAVAIAAQRHHKFRLPLHAFHILALILLASSAIVHAHTLRATPICVAAFRVGEQLGVPGQPHRGNPAYPRAAATDDICRVSREPVLVVLLIVFCGLDCDEGAGAVLLVEHHDLVLLHDGHRWCALGEGFIDEVGVEGLAGAFLPAVDDTVVAISILSLGDEGKEARLNYDAKPFLCVKGGVRFVITKEFHTECVDSVLTPIKVLIEVDGPVRMIQIAIIRSEEANFSRSSIL